jgi:hypothetical protein
MEALSMEERDNSIRMRSCWGWVGSVPLFLAFLVSGCGDGDAPLLTGDASAREVGPDVASGWEAGREAVAAPTDPETCAATASVSPCSPGLASATITRSPASPLLAAVTVTRGGCRAETCVVGCESIRVLAGGNMVGGESCELLVSAVDGRTQLYQIAMVPNPSPTYACCGSPQVLQPGMWVALDPFVLSPSSVVVSFPSLDGGTTLDGAGATLDGNGQLPMDGGIVPTDGRDSSVDVKYSIQDVRYEVHIPTTPPTDEPSCLQATGLLQCYIRAGMDIRAGTPGTLLTKVEVTSGSCGVAGSTCYGGCERFSIFQGPEQTLGSSCDLRVMFWGGGEQTVHVELVTNPSPSYRCCGDPLPPNQGRWVAGNPLLFAPSEILVSSPIDGGPGGIDAPRFFDAPPGPQVPRVYDASPAL